MAGTRLSLWGYGLVYEAEIVVAWLLVPSWRVRQGRADPA
jgi:hypothetical protein